MADAGQIGGGLSGAASGAMMGAQVGSLAGPVGTVVGGVVGAIGGALGGGILGKKKKYKAPARASGAVYGYDAYGNLVNKGSFQYNRATGQYELKAGELSGPEKAMRANLAGNIANLINTVGTTPDSFVRYAKELSDSYFKQGERKLTEQYEKAQTRLDESLARRGMSTSRAAADITGELQGQRMDTLADIYDASQRYGLSSQLQLQQDARSSLGSLANYQGQLSNIDQAYLDKAMKAQQLGQQYENMKAGIDNKNIEMDNASNQQLLGSINQLGSLAGYGLASGNTLGSLFGGSGAATPQWMQQGNTWAQQGMNFNNVGTPTSQLAATYAPSANIAGLGTTNYLAGYYNPLAL